MSNKFSKNATYIPRLRKPDRITLYQKKYGEMSVLEFSLKCGVSTRTIYRDLEEWKKSPEYYAWLDEEWARLYRSDTVPDYIKFQFLSKLKLAVMLENLKIGPSDDAKLKAEESRITDTLRKLEKEYGLKEEK